MPINARAVVESFVPQEVEAMLANLFGTTHDVRGCLRHSLLQQAAETRNRLRGKKELRLRRSRDQRWNRDHLSPQAIFQVVDSRDGLLAETVHQLLPSHGTQSLHPAAQCFRNAHYD